jgi:hypothetical protein
MEAVDSVLMPRLALDNAGLAEPVQRQLALEAETPDWMLSSSRLLCPVTAACGCGNLSSTK